MENPQQNFLIINTPFCRYVPIENPLSGRAGQPNFLKTALSLISTGKSFALSGLSGAGKSTLIHYILSRLDVNCYRPSLVHYGGLQRNGMLKALADVLV